MPNYFRRHLVILLSCLSLLLAAGQTCEAKDGYVKTADGTKLFYQDIGKGKAVVFIPGWLMSGAIWKSQIETLSKTNRVITIDPRGQGASGKPRTGYLPSERARDYQSLIESLHLEKPLLVGWSTGAGELLRYIEQFGDDKLGGVVLVDGLISKQHNPEIIKALESLLITFQKNRNAAMDEFISFLSKKPMTTELINSIKTTAAETPTDAGVVILRDEIELTDFEAALTRVKKPLVFAYTPSLQKNADFLKAKLGEKVQLVRFEESGHALFADEPAKFNQMIRKQLDAK